MQVAHVTLGTQTYALPVKNIHMSIFIILICLFLCFYLFFCASLYRTFPFTWRRQPP